jgi:signal transduction histidine kinase
VLDDGPGIAAELRQKVFERAYRSDAARSRHPGGLGLGLSIALDVAQRHGFELELRDTDAGGTEFELRGPLA